MYSFKYGPEADNNIYNTLRTQAFYENQAAFNVPQANFMNQNAQLGQLLNLNDGMTANPFDSMMPRTEKNVNYYQEYCRLFMANMALTTQLREMLEEKNEILQKINDIENAEKTKPKQSAAPAAVADVGSEKKTRIRKKAAEVERHCKCPQAFCQKSYGSEGSLIQHVKLKHPELTEEPDWKMKILKIDGASEET